MMSADDQNMDLGLALGYSNNCTRPRMNDNSGAGVNARSLVNLTLPASDSLSELVWSPHKGLSLKCAEGSLPDKKSFLLWNVGPINVGPSPSQSIRCTEIDDEKIVAGNLVVYRSELHVDSEAAQRASLMESPKSSVMLIVGSSHGQHLESKNEMDGGKTEEGFLTSSRIQDANHLSGNEKEECDLLKEQMDCMPESNKNDTGLLIPHLPLQGPPVLICDMAKAEALSGNLNKEIPTVLNLTSDNAVIRCQIMEENTTAAEVNIHIQPEARDNRLCLDISTQEVKGASEEHRKNKFSTQGYIVPAENMECTAENDLHHISVKDCNQQSKGRPMRVCSVPLETNGENCSGHFHQLEGKDRALSEGNVSRIFPDDEDESHETVESCNSIFLLGKRRWNLSKQSTVESKRMKKVIDENNASTSIMKHDSSFVNWISNMVNGSSKSNQGDGPCLDLTLAHSSHENTSIIQENVVQETISRNTGFQTIFRSLYCPETKPSEAGTSEKDCSAQGPQDFTQVDKTDVQISPNFSGPNDLSCNDKISLDEKILASVTEDIVGQSCQPLILSSITPVQNDCKIDSTESKDLSNQECCKNKDGTSQSVSLADHKITLTENGNPRASDGIAALSNKRKLLSSSWITRFTSKVCSTSLNLAKPNKDDSLALAIWCPGDCRMSNPQIQTSSEFSVGEKYPDTGVKSKENSGDLVKESLTNAGSSLGSKEIQEHNHCQNAVLSVQPSHLFRTSEAMASTFARRLGAFKHITPTVRENDSSSQIPTCVCCGESGHNLQACSKVREAELMDLRRKKQKSCFVDEEDNLEVAPCSGEKSSINTYVGNPLTSGKEFLSNKSLGWNETQNHNNSSSSQNKTREHQNLTSINLVSMNTAEVPKGVFDAVRRLQLSRADMLKWMNSSESLSHLEGLFLRLRLGKWEAGLGGTGYYVACITVEQTGEPLKDIKKSVSVNVGGMKCLVGSQYISNQDFLEDELMVWWCRILKSGGKVPSKEDLDSKFKRRITLGF